MEKENQPGIKTNEDAGKEYMESLERQIQKTT